MIYRDLFGEDFNRLHPKLKQRYSLNIGETFHATGTMYSIHTGPAILKPVYQLFTLNQFLFPESGKNIPFSLSNHSYLNEQAHIEVVWERNFTFPNATRTFIATMHIDPIQNEAKDYLGSPAVLNSPIQFDVTGEGFLMMRSTQQNALLGALEIPVPQIVGGKVSVPEGYDDVRDVFTIHVSIYHQLFGTMMSYAGEFKEQ